MAHTFDGASSTIAFTDDVLLDGVANLTWDYDVWFTTLTTGDTILHKFVSASGGWKFTSLTANTTFCMTIGAGTNITVTQATQYVINTWQHWTIMYDGSQASNTTRLRAWLDGVERTLTYSLTIPATIAACTNTLSYGYPGTNTHDGRLANVKIWNASLTEAQILQQYRMWRPVVTAGLQYWHPLDDGVLANDYSGGGHLGTVTNCVQSAGPGLSMGRPIMVL